MDPSTSRNGDRLDIVDSLAVSEFKEDVFTFRWNVKNFKERLNNKDEKSELKSPLFTFEKENKYGRQLVVNDEECLQEAAQAIKKIKLDPLQKLDWQLQLDMSHTEKRENSTDAFLSVYLSLKHSKKNEAIKANYKIGLLDGEEKSWKNFSGDKEFEPSLTGWGWKKFLNTKDLLDAKNKLLEDDTLKLYCRIGMKRHVERQQNTLTAATEKDISTQKSPMISDISSMFTSSICTDVSIKTKGSTLKAHKGVLSCRSPVFLAMFQSEMAESIQNVLEIVDFEDDIVKWMLENIYGIEISQDVLTENAKELFRIADKYDINGLKDLVEKALTLNLSVETVVDTLILADNNSIPNLKARAIKFFNRNKEEIMERSDESQKLLNYNPNPSLFKELFTNKGNQR